MLRKKITVIFVSLLLFIGLTNGVSAKLMASNMSFLGKGNFSAETTLSNWKVYVANNVDYFSLDGNYDGEGYKIAMQCLIEINGYVYYGTEPERPGGYEYKCDPIPLTYNNFIDGENLYRPGILWGQMQDGQLVPEDIDYWGEKLKVYKDDKAPTVSVQSPQRVECSEKNLNDCKFTIAVSATDNGAVPTGVETSKLYYYHNGWVKLDKFTNNKDVVFDPASILGLTKAGDYSVDFKATAKDYIQNQSTETFTVNIAIDEKPQSPAESTTPTPTDTPPQDVQDETDNNDSFVLTALTNPNFINLIILILSLTLIALVIIMILKNRKRRLLIQASIEDDKNRDQVKDEVEDVSGSQ